MIKLLFSYYLLKVSCTNQSKNDEMLAHPNPTIIITKVMIKVLTRNAAVAC